MKKILRSLTMLTPLFFLSFVVFSCKNEITPSLFDPNYVSKPQPVIDSVSPGGSALAAIDTISVYGKNFSSTLSENFVFFSGKAGTIVNATVTRLRVTTSATLAGAESVKVAVAGAELFSPTKAYKVLAAVEAFGNFSPPANGATALTPDSAGNLYFDLLGTGADNGIYILSPAGTRTQFAPKTSGITFWSSLKLGPGGYLYAVLGQRRLSRFSSAGVAELNYVVLSSTTNTLTDIDFDQNKNIWAGGNATSLNCVKPTKAVKITSFSGAVHALRVFNGYLYISALKDSAEKIFRAQITGDSLAAPQEYFNLSSTLGSTYVGQSITFSLDGYLYIGTQAPKGLLVVAPNGSYSTPYSSYSSLFGTQANSIAWGPGDVLYVSTLEGNLLKVRTKKSGAPYLGLQ